MLSLFWYMKLDFTSWAMLKHRSVLGAPLAAGHSAVAQCCSWGQGSREWVGFGQLPAESLHLLCAAFRKPRCDIRETTALSLLQLSKRILM